MLLVTPVSQSAIKCNFEYLLPPLSLVFSKRCQTQHRETHKLACGKTRSELDDAMEAFWNLELPSELQIVLHGPRAPLKQLVS